eukprot:1143209-Pelagomonas_calceolata.AAC.3
MKPNRGTANAPDVCMNYRPLAASDRAHLVPAHVGMALRAPWLLVGYVARGDMLAATRIFKVMRQNSYAPDRIKSSPVQQQLDVYP